MRRRPVCRLSNVALSLESEEGTGCASCLVLLHRGVGNAEDILQALW